MAFLPQNQIQDIRLEKLKSINERQAVVSKRRAEQLKAERNRNQELLRRKANVRSHIHFYVSLTYTSQLNTFELRYVTEQKLHIHKEEQEEEEEEQKRRRSQSKTMGNRRVVVHEEWRQARSS